MKSMMINYYHGSSTTPLDWSSPYSRVHSVVVPCDGSNIASCRNKFYLPLLLINNPAVRRRRRTCSSMGGICTSSSSVVLLAVNSSPATTGDLSVLIPTSAAFLFLYWIANFVVPEFVVKDLESQDASKDQSQNEKENIPLSRTINSEAKKKGF